MRMPALRHQAGELAGAGRRAREAYGASRPRTIARALALRAAGGFTVDESLTLGFLDPATSTRSALRVGLVSKRRAMRVQNRLNPAEYRYLLDDKEAFARAAARKGLPTPRTIAVIDGRDGGRLPDGRPLGGLAGWEERLAMDPARAIILKPVNSGRGEGVRVFRRDGGRLSEGEETFSAEDVYASVVRDGRPHVVQERVVDHPGLQWINRSDALQTSRVITFEDQAGIHLAGSGVKLAPPQARIDGRMRFGTVFGIVDVRSGVITELWVSGEGGLGLVQVHRHPTTGAEVIGMSLPLWDEVRALALRASAAFAPLTTFGWDIAITAAGPLLVEGNSRWDPLPHRSSGALIRRMRAVGGPGDRRGRDPGHVS